nr:PAS domain S-box protein [Desulfobulbaceae bacterium]
MTSDTGSATDKFAKLRKRAHGYLMTAPQDALALSQEDVKKLVEELNTYQIELELQNEDLRKTQLKLEQSRNRITDLYDFAPIGYLTVSDKGLIVEANLTAADMLGVAKGILLKQPISAFIIADDQDIYYRCRKKLLETKAPQTSELRMRKKDGTIFHGQLKSTVQGYIDGESGQFRIVITDITERKKAEDALLKAKNEWEQTFDSISDIITLQDQDMRILQANKATSRFFGMEHDTIIGQKCYELFRGTSEPCPHCPVVDTLSDKECHTEMITHERLNKTLMVTSTPLPDVNGHAVTLVHVAKDITEQVNNEEKIRQAQRMQAVGTMAGGIAHEFNNMLGVIMGCAELARDDVPADSFAKVQLDKVIKASYRTRDLVKQILACSRQSQHKCTPLLLKPLIKETIKLIEASLPSSIDLNLIIADDRSKALVDPTEIQQIVMNLCANASWAMKEKGIITVKLDQVTLPEGDLSLKNMLPAGEYVKLSFADNGCGMSKNIMNQIFDPFYTTKEVGKGTGMGLAIVRGIMENYKGTITVDSQIGEGTTFHLYFPVTEEPSAVLPDSSDKVIGGSERILFVDDEEMYAEMGSEMVGRLGYQVEVKTSSSEALQSFKAAPESYDLVITDQIMPALSGEELVKEIRSIRPEIPIILCTGYSTQMDEKKANALGINGFAYKPISKKDIAKLIRQVLDDK